MRHKKFGISCVVSTGQSSADLTTTHSYSVSISTIKNSGLTETDLKHIAAVILNAYGKADSARLDPLTSQQPLTAQDT